MTDHIIEDAETDKPRQLWALDTESLKDWLAAQSASVRDWVEQQGFTASSGTHCVIPGDDGIAGALIGLGGQSDPWTGGNLGRDLPHGTYSLANELPPDAATNLALAWELGGYVFDRYKVADQSKRIAKLIWPETADRERVIREAAGTNLCRTLINTPANDMGPADLAGALEALAGEFGATYQETAGDDLLDQNFPAIHAVGRAAAVAPRLADLTFGDAGAPKVTLVGKGVCFDTGGLDIKPANAMLMMKKDMGGAAHVAGMARILMAMNLNIRLRVLIPAVENSIAGNSMRPMDVVATRKGTSVEIGNTDAEGRVILADALWEAVSESPELIIDFATLTGAARIALGPELPALFCNNDDLADEILDSGSAIDDPLWRLPLWQGYRSHVDGKQADITNAPDNGQGGAITAALFLEHFVTPKEGKAPPWAHVDVMAWNNRARPGRPVGGEAMGMRAMTAMIESRFGP